jgi:hypothetical protein
VPLLRRASPDARALCRVPEPPTAIGAARRVAAMLVLMAGSAVLPLCRGSI